MATAVACFMLAGSGLAQEPPEPPPAAWTGAGKLRVHWLQGGSWVRRGTDLAATMASLARLGATVVVDSTLLAGEGQDLIAGPPGWHCNLTLARAARAVGCRYLASYRMADFVVAASELGGEWRQALDREGRPLVRHHICPCPLDESVYDACFMETVATAAASELVDGLHLDFALREGREEAPECYCDDCFRQYLEMQERDDELPAATERFSWLRQQGLTYAYQATFRKRRTALWRRFAQRIHEINPDFVFSGHDMAARPAVIAGLHDPSAPFLLLDAAHTGAGFERSWWDVGNARWRHAGVLLVAGAEAATFSGRNPASAVDTVRWLYEAALHSDGYWLDARTAYDTNLWHAFWLAENKLQPVMRKLGSYLSSGSPDRWFVTVVEGTGAPRLARVIRHASYHVGEEHLVQLDNVAVDCSVRFRISFPGLAAAGQWAVRDPLRGLVVRPSSERAAWTGAELRQGIQLVLGRRQDAFLLLTPREALPDVAELAWIRAPLYPFPTRFPKLAPASTELPRPAGAQRLLYVSTRSPTASPSAAVAVRNSIYALNARYVGGTPLPVVWRFRTDPEDIGLKQDWPTRAAVGSWAPIRIDQPWTEQGYAYRGAAWYALKFDYSEAAPAASVRLHFGAVDGYADIFLDGVKVAEQKTPPARQWDQPFSCTIEGPLTPGPHTLMMRVEKNRGTAGIWRPVRIEIGGTQRLYGFDGHVFEPAWSPNGTMVAFTANADSRGQIHVMHADGSNVKNISSNSFCDRSPQWSPDGQRLAFVSDRDADWEVYVMNADGTEPVRLTTSSGRDDAPAWSPDGSRILFRSERGLDADIYVMNTDGSEAYTVGSLPGEESNAVWGPGGEKVAFSAKSGKMRALLVLAADGSDAAAAVAAVQVRGDPNATSRCLLAVERAIESVAWSPDAQYIAAAFHRAGELGQTGILVLRADGTGRRNLALGTAVQPYAANGAEEGPEANWYSATAASPRWVLKTFTGVSWSADGTTVAFSSDMDGGSYHVYTVPIDGGDPKRLDITRSTWPQTTAWAAPAQGAAATP